MYNISNPILELLSNKICTDNNYKKAKEYLKSKRGLNSDLFKYRPFLTGDVSKFVEMNESLFKNDWLSDSIFFPLYSIENSKLIGFDVRYVGGDSNRTRYYKIKLNDSKFFNYGAEDIFKNNKIAFICEGVIDLETLRCITLYSNDYSFLSPLTCLTNKDYLETLLCCFEYVVIAYDNDSSGTSAKSKIKKFKQDNSLENILFLNFLGKDINESFLHLGEFSVKNGVKELGMFIK